MKSIPKHDDDLLTVCIISELQREDRVSDEDIIDMILVERPDWTRDWAVDLLEKCERALRS